MCAFYAALKKLNEFLCRHNSKLDQDSCHLHYNLLYHTLHTLCSPFPLMGLGAPGGHFVSSLTGDPFSMGRSASPGHWDLKLRDKAAPVGGGREEASTVLQNP